MSPHLQWTSSDTALEMGILHGDYPSQTIKSLDGPPSQQMEILWGFVLTFSAE